MILLTVGTQLPFDRLVAAMDRIAPQLAAPVIAQTGDGKYRPANMKWRPRFDPVEFDRVFRDAAVIVAHAGIGTVLTARKYGKPVVLFPRRAELGEHRNDHQAATVAQLAGRQGIYVARTEDELMRALTTDTLESTEGAAPDGRAALISHISNYIAKMAR